MQNPITMRQFEGAQFIAPLAARRTPRRGEDGEMNCTPTPATGIPQQAAP
jgi:hypothetical protein